MAAVLTAPHPSVSVIVPVYNSEGSLPELVDRLAAVLPKICPDYELILVNDGSADRSWDVINELARARSWVRAVDLMRNYGQHNALLCGIRAAKNDLIVTIDDDLQNPPEEIPRLLDKLAEGYDVAYGTPHSDQHGLCRNLASRITKLALQTAMGAETAHKVSAFRAFRTRLRESFAGYQNPSVSIDVLLTWGTTRFVAVPVAYEPRRVGRSNYTFRKLVNHALDMMTGFSTLPLRMASVVGFAFTVFGFIVLAYVIIGYLVQGGSVPGFTFLASAIAVFSGAQLFAIGIIGEYLSRMYQRTLEKPPYVVLSTSGARDRLEEEEGS